MDAWWQKLLSSLHLLQTKESWEEKKLFYILLNFMKNIYNLSICVREKTCYKLCGASVKCVFYLSFFLFSIYLYAPFSWTIYNLLLHCHALMNVISLCNKSHFLLFSSHLYLQAMQTSSLTASLFFVCNLIACAR